MTSKESVGRPVSMPPLPRVDYPLPRATVSSSMSQIDNKSRVQGGRKVIRTPSGKNYSATEYLRGIAHVPSQPSLVEGMYITYIGQPNPDSRIVL